jgi:pantoate--beta-alanine ligase
VLDLAIPTAIVAYPTVREPDGLAMSSRNRYLSDAERRVAAGLFAALQATASELADGRPAEAPVAAARDRLLAAGFDGVDYVALCDAADLRPLERAGERPARLLAAARLGGTRLIDNVPVGARSDPG